MEMMSLCAELQVCSYGKSQNTPSMKFLRQQPKAMMVKPHHHHHKASIYSPASQEQMLQSRIGAIHRSSMHQEAETEVKEEEAEEEEEKEEKEKEGDLSESSKRLEIQMEKVEKQEEKTRGKVRVYNPDDLKISKTGKGAKIADFLRVFGHLLERPFGGGEIVAKAGAVVIDKVTEETKNLLGQEGVRDEAVIEILKFLRLLEMDMELVAAARKDETLVKRLESAISHCKKAFLVADAI